MAAVLVGATALVDSRVLAMGRAVVDRAGYSVGVVTSGYRPGAIVKGTSHESLHAEHLAIDIGATGSKLIRLGQAALELAGVPDAHRYTSWVGQSTPRGWEILFNTKQFGDHTNHLHLGFEGNMADFHLPGLAPAGHYDFQGLMQLWVNNGGSRASAAMAAQVASLESGGNPQAHNKTFREDSRGLWQINVKSNAHPEYAASNLYDPNVNAKAAIRISRNGQSWSQWSTANAARAALAARGKVDVPDRSRPGGESGGGGGFLSGVGGIFGGAGSALGDIWNWGNRPASEIFNLPNPLEPLADLVKLFIWLFSPINWLRMIEFVMGVALLLLGIATLVVEFAKRSSTTGRLASGVINRTPFSRQMTDFERGALRGARERDYNEGRRAARQQETRSNPESFRPRPVYRVPRRG